MSRLPCLLAVTAALAVSSGCTIHTSPAPSYTAGYQAAPTPAPAATPAPAPQAPAQQAPQFLGARSVGLHADHDVIMVTAAEGQFRQLRLHVSGSPLEMYNVRVTFADGSHFSPATRLVFDQGAYSRVIDLPGGARVIRRVDFWYRSLGPRNGRANVQLFGS